MSPPTPPRGLPNNGKGGVIRHVLKGVDPQGVEVFSFGRPTEEEKRHDFLHRPRIRMPKPGRIGVWDRSHYEAVLVEKVKELTRSTRSRDATTRSSSSKTSSRRRAST